MKKTILALAIGLSMSLGQARADEGMWLMQQLSAQYKQMQERGLKLQERDIYDPSGSALQDAVVIFDQGCTGEVISQSGLILTNHHCGYDAIRALSSVEHNYLEDGFWAQSLSAELPTKGVSVTFIDAIEDVTGYVKRELSKIKDPNDMSYLSPKYLDGLAKKRVGKLPKGVEVEIKAFYNGNRYLMFTKKVYTDVRFVGAPPSSIGKFGADTDNWEYPRHAGDFSIFRVYTDPAGNPADYAPQQHSPQAQALAQHLDPGHPGGRLCHGHRLPRAHQPLLPSRGGGRVALYRQRYPYPHEPYPRGGDAP